MKRFGVEKALEALIESLQTINMYISTTGCYRRCWGKFSLEPSDIMAFVVGLVERIYNNLNNCVVRVKAFMRHGIVCVCFKRKPVDRPKRVVVLFEY